jgi:putative FmdB family regulatory protein
MPIYEYKCGKCGHVFETLQRISDAPLTECPACGEPALKKLVSAAAFRLKGGGWYETDFKTGNKKNVDQGDKKPDKKSDKKAGKASDAKAASGSTAKPKKTGGAG